MTEKHEFDVSATAGECDRRRVDRRGAEGTVRALVGALELHGRLRDVSSSGLFLDLEGELVFDVEYEHGGQAHRRVARLIRSQRLSGTRSGWAIEFLE